MCAHENLYCSRAMTISVLRCTQDVRRCALAATSATTAASTTAAATATATAATATARPAATAAATADRRSVRC